MRKLLIMATALMPLGVIGPVAAQTNYPQLHCGYVGQEFCVKGETYRCEQTASQVTAIFKNQQCVVNAPSLVGIWRGQGHQTPAGATGSDWSIEMTIRDGGGAIEYPSLGCGGNLTQVSQNGTSAQYRETITHGSNCVNGGMITVNYVNGKLAWTWVGAAGGKQYNAIAALTR